MGESELVKERGFSLLEVMIALAILSLVLVAAFRLQVLDLGLVRAGQEVTGASLAAESLFWRWTVFGPPPAGEETEEAGGFRIKVSLEPDEVWPGLLRASLEVSGRPGEPVKRFGRLFLVGEAK